MIPTLIAFLGGYALREYLAWITTANTSETALDAEWQRWRRRELATWWAHVGRIPYPVAEAVARMLPLAWL
jgi:hypothetical protein